jgi:hypothetical protein
MELHLLWRGIVALPQWAFFVIFCAHFTSGCTG